MAIVVSNSVGAFQRFLSRRHRRRSTSQLQRCCPPDPAPAVEISELEGKTVVMDVDGWLLPSTASYFSYFMLVALEAGGFLRGLVLLLVYPFLLLPVVSGEMRMKAMVFVSFFLTSEEQQRRVGKAVLPRVFSPAVPPEAAKAVRTAKAVAVSALPRLMVQGFLKEYLGVEAVAAREVKALHGRCTGVMADGADVDELAGGAAFWFAASRRQTNKVVCDVAPPPPEADKAVDAKAVVFHDGRIAFTPTPASTVAMFLYLPLAVLLAIVRAVAFSVLPYRISIPFCALTGVRSRLVSPPPAAEDPNSGAGRLYVCNHRTLLDPVCVAAAVGRPVTAVTYSVSRISEVISPIPTVRLTRDREEDRRRMAALLEQGKDLVICPEGTTCREPYLLRFSPLFAELVEEVSPVAVKTAVSMFHGTSTRPASKFMDPFYFLMNPWPEYRLEFLDTMATVAGEEECAGAGDDDDGRRRRRIIDAANRVQSAIGQALGFELTSLTRRHKYMMLAGNEGVVAADGDGDGGRRKE